MMVAAKEKTKGTEQLELMQGDGVAGAATRSDRGDLALRCSPWAATRSMGATGATMGGIPGSRPPEGGRSYGISG